MNPERWQQVADVFFGALDRGPDERRGFLEEACGRDETLRAEVEALLDSDEKANASGFLRPAPKQPPRAGARAFDQASTEPIALTPPSDTVEDLPATFGRYRIVKQLGAGGMGTVYLAVDTALDRRVAIKVPHEEYERSPEAVARFQREARAAAAFQHPNFCPVHDVGQIDGHHFIAMAYLEGRPLSVLIDPARPMEPERAVAWVMRVALVIAEAHKQKIIHRDLKPSNVMIDERGEPIIMDFGLARWIEDDGPELTRSGLLLGSPHYMAPEQVEGGKALIGPACDVYSLGVILYELLAGQRPFRGSTPRILALILTQEPASVSTLRPGIDSDLERICLKAMAKKIEDRYPSMTAFTEALATWLARHRLASLEPSGNPSIRTTPVVNGEAPPAESSLVSPGHAQQPRSSEWISLSGTTRWATVLLGAVIGILALELWRATVQRAGSEGRQGMTPASVARTGPSDASPTAFPYLANPHTKNSVGMELVRIEPGWFSMGSPDTEGLPEEHPRHPVRIARPFLLGTYEVTWPQYHAVIDNESGNLGDPDQHPISDVTWSDAARFCNKLSIKEGLPPYYDIRGEGDSAAVTIVNPGAPGYRLPTEAEWEYACRAGTTSVYPFGTDASLLGQYAWFNQNSGKILHAVGRKQPNAWGLYDMLGNAWEWCQDGYDAASYQHATTVDPQRPAEAKQPVIRGGSVYDDLCCRPAARQGQLPEMRLPWFGFRVAAFPPGEASNGPSARSNSAIQRPR